MKLVLCQLMEKMNVVAIGDVDEGLEVVGETDEVQTRTNDGAGEGSGDKAANDGAILGLVVGSADG